MIDFIGGFMSNKERMTNLDISESLEKNIFKESKTSKIKFDRDGIIVEANVPPMRLTPIPVIEMDELNISVDTELKKVKENDNIFTQKKDKNS